MKFFGFLVLLLVAMGAPDSSIATPDVSSPQGLHVTVAVDGLACPFCAYGLEKRLKDVDGMTLSKIDINQGTATLKVKEEEPLDFEVLRKAVKKAGFTPGEISVVGTGLAKLVDGQAALITADGTILLELEPKDSLRGITATHASTIQFAGKVIPQSEDEKRPGIPRVELDQATILSEQ